MKTKPISTILLSVAFLLLIPLTAMQFTTAVNWHIMDFVIAGALLLGLGFLVDLVLRKITKFQNRGILLMALLIAFILIWAELAVGIFGTPIGGS